MDVWIFIHIEVRMQSHGCVYTWIGYSDILWFFFRMGTMNHIYSRNRSNFNCSGKGFPVKELCMVSLRMTSRVMRVLIHYRTVPIAESLATGFTSSSLSCYQSSSPSAINDLQLGMPLNCSKCTGLTLKFGGFVKETSFQLYTIVFCFRFFWLS